jgi:hypothetical protein
MVRRRPALLALLFLAAALVLVAWSAWLVLSLPYHYVSTRRGIGWAGLRPRTRQLSPGNLNHENRRSM